MIDANGTPRLRPDRDLRRADARREPAEGPFVAPADVLLTDARYRSKQAATDDRPVRRRLRRRRRRSPRSGKYAVLAATKHGRRHARPAPPARSTSRPRPPTRSRASASKAPKVAHRHAGDGQGRHRQDRHARAARATCTAVDFADVVGKKPVALLFSTPQLCQSRVCGPVTDIELQMKSKYGDKMDFIHQEVYVDNDINKGLRPAAAGSSTCATEPWLFVVDKHGQHHRPARGLDRRDAVRGRGQVRPVRRRSRRSRRRWPPRCSCRRPPRRTASSSASSCRSRSGCSRGRPRRCSCISFFALAVLWPQPRLEQDDWRPLPGGTGDRLACRSQIVCGAIGVAAARRHDPGRLRRRRHGAGQLGADVHPDHVLGRAGVRVDPVRRRLPRASARGGRSGACCCRR